MKAPATPQKAYLVDVDQSGGGRLEFQFAPADLSDEKGVVFAKMRVPGLSHPRLQYVAGDARVLQFTVTFYRVPDLRQRVRWLQSLQYPEHTGNAISSAPHRVMLLFGSLFQDVVWVVPSVKVKYSHPFTAALEPLRADVEMTLEEFIEVSRDMRDI